MLSWQNGAARLTSDVWRRASPLPSEPQMIPGAFSSGAPINCSRQDDRMPIASLECPAEVGKAFHHWPCCSCSYWYVVFNAVGLGRGVEQGGAESIIPPGPAQNAGGDQLTVQRPPARS